MKKCNYDFKTEEPLKNVKPAEVPTLARPRSTCTDTLGSAPLNTICLVFSLVQYTVLCPLYILSVIRFRIFMPKSIIPRPNILITCYILDLNNQLASISERPLGPRESVMEVCCNTAQPVSLVFRGQGSNIILPFA